MLIRSWSLARPARMALRIPVGSPISTAKSVAQAVRLIVGSSRSAIACVTERPRKID
jgi:hypothetical protein